MFINTGQEFDGSDSGARPDEAISWGKIRIDSSPVKVYCDASLVFPIIVAETFAKYHHYRFVHYTKMSMSFIDFFTFKYHSLSKKQI